MPTRVQDLAGDAFFMGTVRIYRKKEWVARMMIPYIVLFATSCAASVASSVVKGKMLVHKLRSRWLTGATHRLSVVAGVKISTAAENSMAASARHLEKAHALNETFAENRMMIWQNYCRLLTAVFEDVPMGTYGML